MPPSAVNANLARSLAGLTVTEGTIQMKPHIFVAPLSRRCALSLSCATIGSFAMASSIAKAGDSQTSLPVDQIEQILGASGTVQNGVLSVEIDRTDAQQAFFEPEHVLVLPEFELNGTLYFQPLGGGQAILNADLCLFPDETNKFIDALIANDLIVMAFHQHFFDLNPIFWFVHWCGVGDPIALATASRNAIGVTRTPLPQPAPSMTTPFDADKLASILGGTAEVGGSGVVTVSVARQERIRLGGIPIKSETGVSTTVAFEPLDASGQKAVGAPDFALIGEEVDPVFQIMSKQGFKIGCLYNQETDEKPQLYFSHQWKVGDPYELAREIRNGLDLTNSKTV
jgi:hypothetical protein